MRFVKTTGAGMLQLGCADHEFDQHVGVGVALYMRFVKITGAGMPRLKRLASIERLSTKKRRDLVLTSPE